MTDKRRVMIADDSLVMRRRIMDVLAQDGFEVVGQAQNGEEALITESAGNFTASQGAAEFAPDALKAQFQASFPPEAIDNIKWYPPVPAGLEAIEGGILDRIKAAN